MSKLILVFHKLPVDFTLTVELTFTLPLWNLLFSCIIIMISVSFFHERSITMSTNNKNLHLTDQDRIIIEKTLYNYIEDGVFREFDLLDVDLRIKTKRRITKKASNKYKKREDRKYLKGRTSFYLLELKIVPIFSFEHSIEIFAVIFKFFFFFNKYSSKFSFVNSRSMPSV